MPRLTKKKNKRSRSTVAAKTKREVTLLGQALRTLGGLGGGAIGSMLGQGATGASVGTSLGAAISKWLGSGDYTVKQNSIVSASLKGSNSIPMMHNQGQSVIIRHKEFLCVVRGSKSFKLQRFFPLQPGDSNTFPWLHGVADRFQQYRIRGMVFHYVPTSGYAVSGLDPALGAVMIQTSYRANDSDPANKVEMLNEYWASENVPSDAFCHPIECAPSENPFQVHYVRTVPVPSGDSPMLYDLGKTFIATQGMPDDDKVVGDLWVTYEIELMKPQIASSTLTDVVSAFLQSNGTLTAGSTPLGNTTSVALTGSSLAVSMLSRTVTFPVGTLGKFLCVVRVVASSTFTAFDASGAPSYTNCTDTSVNAIGLGYTRTVMTAGTSTLNAGYYVFGVNITDPSVSASVQIAGMSWTGVAASSELTVSPLT